MSLNHDLSALFRTMAAVFEIRGEPVFKSIAFSKVSRLLKDMTVDIKKLHDQGQLETVEGIGSSSRKVITDYITTGRSPDYEEVVGSIPQGLIPLLDIPSLGPKTIRLFWKERGVTDMAQLVDALASGTLEGLKGIGEKKLDSIRQGIQLLSQSAGRMGLPDALNIGAALVERLRALKGVKQAEIAGSLRRWKETIGDVDLVCCLSDMDKADAISESFTQFPEVERVLGQGTTKASVLTAGGLQVDLRIVPPDNFGAALLYFTGSKDHNVRIRGLAQDKDLTLNEWGLYKKSEYDKAEKKTAQAPAAKPVASKTEADIYKKLGLAFIPPELREDRGEVQAAAGDKLPTLIDIADYRGDLHSHTVASDGQGTIEQMAEAAKALGYEYLAITDHSKSQAIANGLSVERLLKHIAAIRKASDKIKGITLLAGSEVDILADGRLDYEEEVLAELDFVVASPHVALKQDAEKATARILRAIESRYVNVIGHPTGRLISAREGLPLDIEAVTKAAAATGTALEINSGYPRLDLNDIHAHAAIDAGAMLSINTDSHSVEEFPSIVLGLHVARRAWATKEHVINCLPLKDLRTFIARKR